MMKPLAVIDDPLFERHVAPGPHPERPERLSAVRDALAGARIQTPRLELDANEATDEELVRVHTAHYIAELGHAAGHSGYFDPDTYYCPDSIAAARKAAGAMVALSDALMEGSSRFGVALLRPPGHHARPNSAMGFCLLNNVAVGAAHARARGAERVLILDWDVHHGNGTQEIFFDDPALLYLSLHQFPFYPGTGAVSELGTGEGRGYNVNIPLSAGATDAVYQAAFDRIVCPIVEQFDPDLLLISAGFDAHQRDPLAMMQLTSAGYAGMTRRVLRSLPRPDRCGVGIVLEGGYDLQALRESMTETLEALYSTEPAPGQPSPSEPVLPRYDEELAQVRRALSPHWRLP